MICDWLHSWKRSPMACNLHLSASPPLACQKIHVEKDYQEHSSSAHPSLPGIRTIVIDNDGLIR